MRSELTHSSLNTKRIFSEWKSAGRELLKCLSIGVVVGVPFYLGFDWWWHKDIGKPQYGGQVRMTEQNHIEMVVGKDRITVYITDHEGHPSDLADTLITVTRDHGETVELFEPAGGNRMVLIGDYSALPKDVEFLLTFDRNCEKPLMTAFTPMTPEEPFPFTGICLAPRPEAVACRIPRSTRIP